MSPNSSLVTWEQPHVLHGNTKGGLTPFMQLQRFLRYLSQLERNPEFPLKLEKSACSPPHLKLWAYSPALTWEESRLPLVPQEEACLTYSTREEPWGSCCKFKGHQAPTQLWIMSDSPEDITLTLTSNPNPNPTRMEPWVPLTTRREVWLPCYTSRKSPFPTSTWDEALSPMEIREESRGAHCKFKGGLTSLKHKRRFLRSPSQLKRNSKLPSATRE